MPSERSHLPRRGQLLIDNFNSWEMRPAETLLAAACIAALTNGPSIALSHLYNIPLGWERWPYMVPMGLAALVGVFMCGRDVTLGHVRRYWIPLVAVGAYLTWCIASVRWSVSPNETAVRSLLTTGAAAFGVWYGVCLRFKEQLLSLFTATSALCIWSLGLIIVQPKTHLVFPPATSAGTETQAFGVFGNPNSLGPVAVLAVLTSVAIWILFPTLLIRAMTSVMIVIGLILTFWSQCETAIGGLVLVVAVVAATSLLPYLRRVSGWLVGGSLAAACLLGWRLFFDHIDRLAPALGADSMLSSRRIIWADVRRLLKGRPWRGYGFFAFWDNPTYTQATYHNLGSDYGSAHNSVLEVALGLGRVGLVLYLFIAVLVVGGIGRAVWARTGFAQVAWLAMVMFLIAQNAMESFVLWHSYLWAIFVAAALVPIRMGVRRDESVDLIPIDVEALAQLDDEPAGGPEEHRPHHRSAGALRSRETTLPH